MSPPSEIGYRRATPDDLEAMYRVFLRAEGAVYRARNYEWQDPPLEAFSIGNRHLMERDPERIRVAERDGRVVGFGGAFVRDGTWFLSRLFIDPDAQARGIGRRLFELVAEGAPARRMTITDSFQPISNALYGRNGLLPVSPLIRLTGTLAPRTDSTGLEVGEASVDELAPVDLAAYGFARGVDHDFWASGWARRAWFRRGELVGWSYRWPTGKIGPLAAIDGATAAAVYRAEVAAGGPVEIEAPASSRALVAAGLADGLRISPQMGLVLGTDDVVPPTSLAISTYGFY